MRRLLVIVLLRAGKAGVAAFQQLLRIDQRLGLTGEPQQCLRRRTQRLPGGSSRRHNERRRIQARDPAQLDPQDAVSLPQALPWDQLRPRVRRILQPVQPQAALLAFEATLPLCRLHPHPGPRRPHLATRRHLQLDMQSKGARLLRVVDMGVRQTILTVERTGCTLCVGLLAQQLLVDTGLLPVAGLEVTAQYTQVHGGDGAGLQARQ
ncbi:hypothetical protein D3C75_963420 [compost metagenome]